MLKKSILLFVFTFIMGACQNQSPESTDASSEDAQATSTQVKELQQDVMAVHDRVMPKMNKMSQLQTELKNTAVGMADSAKFMAISSDLNQAQEGMMDWMRNFKYPEEEGWSTEQTKDYLKQQHNLMLQVEQQTNLSIHRADSILEAARLNSANSN